MGVNIKGLDKAKLLQALFNSAKPVGLGFFDPSSNKPMSYADAQEIVAKGNLYFDYLRGRKMKLDISGDEINSFSDYESSAGSGALLKVVTALRNNQDIEFKAATPTNKMEALASQGKFEEAVAQPEAQISIFSFSK